MSTASSPRKMSSSSSTKHSLSLTTDDTDVGAMGLKYIAATATTSPPAQMLEKYFSIMSATEVEHPRFNLLNKTRPRSSSLLNINDPVAMHLLVETAIIDSDDYEILSFEEVEEFKKEYQFLSSRIDASRRKLALESKVRDAALSLSRLNKKGRRKSILGLNNDVGSKTEEELMQSTKKCEKLVEELWTLSVRAWEIQRRLLQHGAGILGMTHQGGSRPMTSANSKGTGIVTSSPSSKSPVNQYIYGYPRMSFLQEDEFDSQSMYNIHDRIDPNPTGSMGEHRKRGSKDSAKYTNSIAFGNGISNQNVDVLLENKLMGINTQIRGVLSKIGKASFSIVNGKSAGVQEQMIILEEGVKLLAKEDGLDIARPTDSEQTETQLAKLWDIIAADEELNANGNASDSEIEDYDVGFSLPAFSAKVESLCEKSAKLKKQVLEQRQMLAEQHDAAKDKLQAREEELRMELDKIEAEKEMIAIELQQRELDVAAASAEINSLQEELEVVTEELKERGLGMSDQHEEIQNLREEMSSLKQKLMSEDVSDSEKKGREAVQAELEEKERELKAKIANEENLLRILEEKETELMGRIEVEEELRAQLKQQEGQMSDRGGGEVLLEAKLREKESELADMENRFEEMKDDRNITKAELDAAKTELESYIAETAERIRELENEANKAKIQSETETTKLRSVLQERELAIEKSDVEMRQLVEKVANLSTELAIKTAELDQAYGSRQQRAAETAEQIRAAQLLEQANKSLPPDPTILREIDDLKNQNQALLLEIENVKAAQESAARVVTASLEKRNGLLQQELNGMLQNFEALTKLSIEFEAERTELENKIDELREKIEQLETHLADEKVRMLGATSRSMSVSSVNGDGTPPPRSARLGGGGEGILGETTSTAVLKSEFKRMMREMRAEQMKLLRAETDERRRLEGIIRKMRAEQAQANRKGPSTQSMAS